VSAATRLFLDGSDGNFSTLVDKDYPEGYQTFMQSSGINHVVIKMEGTKKVEIPQSVMNSILEVVMDRQNHPLLLHCNQGRVSHPLPNICEEAIY
jgi:hypothetical protein